MRCRLGWLLWFGLQSALQQLLTVGLVVETVPDASRPEGRPRRPRRPRQP